MLRQDAARSFLSNDWQRRCTLLPGGVDRDLPVLDRDEVAWLATLPDVESRIVVTERDATATRYRLETGPFPPERLAKLPERDWTLLVNDVEKHLPDFRAYLALVDFLPDWRVDDLMISIAAPGGSVGPHVDNYDVFLVQDGGTREWRVGATGDTETDEASDSLSLLKPYDAAHHLSCKKADVLYLPPRLPHWGIAQDFCTTYSIGMRAPSRAELRLTAARLLDTDIPGEPGENQAFYEDPDLGPDEASPGLIHPRAVSRLREQSLIANVVDARELATVLGCTVTDPKAWLAPDSIEGPDATRMLAAPGTLRVHGMAKIAWYAAADALLVFVNGRALSTDPGRREDVVALCRQRCLDATRTKRLAEDDSGQELMRWMMAAGLFDAGETHG
jgi:50S ribosomal protein L16 3-hydroxylase